MPSVEAPVDPVSESDSSVPEPESSSHPKEKSIPLPLNAELRQQGTLNYKIDKADGHRLPFRYVVSPKSYRLADVADEEAFMNILALIDKIAMFTDVGDNKFAPGEAVEMGYNLIFRTAKENVEEQVLYDTPQFEEWAAQYPATEDYYGPATAYLPGKYLRQTKEKYYCKDCENISFEEADDYYNAEADIYSIIVTGNEVSTLPILHSIEESETRITAVFSFLNYVFASEGDLFDRDGGDIKGSFTLTELVFPEYGTVTFAEPYVPPENREALRRVKITFCKEGDAWKVHRMDYLP